MLQPPQHPYFPLLWLWVKCACPCIYTWVMSPHVFHQFIMKATGTDYFYEFLKFLKLFSWRAYHWMLSLSLYMTLLPLGSYLVAPSLGLPLGICSSADTQCDSVTFWHQGKTITGVLVYAGLLSMFIVSNWAIINVITHTFYVPSQMTAVKKRRWDHLSIAARLEYGFLQSDSPGTSHRLMPSSMKHLLKRTAAKIKAVADSRSNYSGRRSENCQMCTG